MTESWQDLLQRQEQLVARRQLAAFGLSRHHVRNQVAAGRWLKRSSTVVSTFTGPLAAIHRCWLGILHAGEPALVAGLTAAELHGLRRWERGEITILVGHHRVIEPVEGIRFVRTRRDFGRWRHPDSALPLCRPEPAILWAAAYDVGPRSGQGLLAAAVQQRITTAAALRTQLAELTPLYRAPLFREVLDEISGGAQSLGEIDIARMCRNFGLPLPVRQRQRRDAAGRRRYTDCEWDLPDGHVLVLEVDGGFHMEVEHWEADIVRERDLLDRRRHLVRCTTRELRDSPERVAAALRRFGIRSPRVAQRAV